MADYPVQRLGAQAVRLVCDGRNLDTALDNVLGEGNLSSSQRATVQALSYGTLRELGYVRFAVSRLAPRPQKNALLSSLLWVAVYQLEHSSAPYAVVDGAVESAGAIGGAALKPFVNAVLRNYLRRRDEIRSAALLDDEARFSYPLWWIRKLREQIGDAAEAVLDAGNQHPPMTLRVNVRRTDVDSYRDLLMQQSVASQIVGPSAVKLDEPARVEAVPGFAGGLVSVQDSGAQHAAALLAPRHGERVLDACAAPGGKTAHLLEIADIELIALDRDPQRLSRVEQNLQRLGLGAEIRCADAGDLHDWWDGRPFDKVLLDAPCSASGVVRRHPDIKWLRRADDLARFASQQQRLLEALWNVVARGGKLLYATCSVFREENQDQVDAFLSRFTDARLLEQPDDGVLLPNQEHDGFFYALIEKA